MKTSGISKLTAVFLAGAILTASRADAMTRRSGETVIVQSGETISGMLYATGEHVRTVGEVQGDLVVFAKSQQVFGNVGGNLLAAVGAIGITRTVNGSVLTPGAAVISAETSAGMELYFMPIDQPLPGHRRVNQCVIREFPRADMLSGY